eukprot:4156398-Ditylum_brightwellii.AAC.1
MTCIGKHDGLFNMSRHKTTAAGNVVITYCVMILKFNKDGKVKKYIHYFVTFGMIKAAGALLAAYKD